MFNITFNDALRVKAKLIFSRFLRKKTFYFFKSTRIKDKIYNRRNKKKEKKTEDNLFSSNIGN